MTRWRYIWRSLVHHRRTHLAVMLSVAIATAVLTGALLVGDSVRGSLRDLTLERLGQIDHVLITDRFFRQELVDELSGRPEFKADFRQAVPACVIAQTTVERSVQGSIQQRVRGVMLVGCDDRFWQLDPSRLPRPNTPGENQVVINATLAAALGPPGEPAQAGDQLVLRLPDFHQVPADSPLGRKEGQVRTLTSLEIMAVLPAEGLARFSLLPSQQDTSNAFVSLTTLQNALGQGGRVNTILVTERKTADVPPAGGEQELNRLLQPRLEDFGISITRQRKQFEDANGERPPVTVWDYFNVTTDRLLWNDAARNAAQIAFHDWQPQEVLTYLANTIAKVDSDHSRDEPQSRGIPYSTIAATDNHPLLGPLEDGSGTPLEPLRDGQLALNRWAAEQLQAHVGDRIAVTFFEPETSHGQTRQRTESFSLVAIAPLTEPARPYRRGRKSVFAQPPTRANDPDLTPTVAGVTDQQSINDWDPPFPFDQSRITRADDHYWDYHRTTPKAFLPLETGKRIWASRFGTTTSFRIPVQEEVTLDAVSQRLVARLRDIQQTLGFRFQPVKRSGLLAAKGTTPFEYLFLGFSLFLIASALMLIAILFRLGVELRAVEMGTLLAQGWRTSDVRRVTLAETSMVALAGAAVGVLAGVAYAALMLAGLRSWWVAAIVTPFLRLHVPWVTCGVGLLGGVLTALVVVRFSLRVLGRVTPCTLLAGRLQSDIDTVQPPRRSAIGWSIGLGIGSLGLGVAATRLSGEAQAGAFFGSGACALVAALLLTRFWLARQGSVAPSNSQLSSFRLACRTAARNPGRSTLTIGLMSSATFLIVAIASFRLGPDAAGTGGFALLAESDRPLFYDFSDENIRSELFGDRADQLAGATILGFRVHAGDDASCRNLYQTGQPELLGVTPRFVADMDRYPQAFAWSAHEPVEQGRSKVVNPWHCLNSGPDQRGAIPVVLDKNTAIYSLHLPPTIGHEFELTYDRPIRFRIAGLLSNTMLQGRLLLRERDLVRLFPDSSGYQMFLIRTHRRDQEQVASRLLEERFGDEGLDVRSSSDVLRGLLAVQNTYLSTFQSLGGLGLLLGTLGLAAVQIRNVLARRGELALLSAVGFRAAQIRRQLIWEQASLLLAGLGIGLWAALIAVIPHGVYGAARLPLWTLGGMLLLILATGLLAGTITAKAAARTRLLSALRGD